MGRVINTDSPGKRRNHNLRTIAEILRRLTQKSDIDQSTKDMVAMLVFCLREIDEGIEHSAAVWEQRDYWMKAEEFRQKWSWVSYQADLIASVVLSDDWDKLPKVIMDLLPQVADIKVTKMTRKESLWQGAYDKLMREKPPSTSNDAAD